MPGVVHALSTLALASAIASACALHQRDVARQLEKRATINCATAEGDLRVLQSEKVNLAQRIAEGVTAVTPAGAVLGAAAGTEGTELQVATGKYNAMIDARIAEIVHACGIGGY